MDAYSPNPAALLDRRWNILYANTDYLRVLQGLDAQDDNFLDWLFLDDNSRSVVIDYPSEALHLIGRFRFVCVAHRDDPEIMELLQHLTGDPLFARGWKDAVTVLADGPAVTPMCWHDHDTGNIFRVSEEPVPGTEWLTLQVAVPIP
ncbi:MmyB family transcriptional regulator [Nocardia alni]|uniref:MmyB family transcriptional regulator n=1 Tax=Nocardia alni TaxID=2815723 RepID=UPI001C245E38|nr:hypothetical protein [Nocardia alni]